LAGCVASTVPLFSAIEVLDEIVCKVNGEIITRSDLEKDRLGMEAQLRQQGLTGTKLDDAVNREAVNLLRDRIDSLLEVSKAKQEDLKVDSELTKRIAGYQLTSGQADPEKFQQWIVDNAHMPYADFKTQLKNDLLRQRLIGEEVSRKIQFKTEELQAYYDGHKDQFMREERVFLREILISTQGKDEAGVAAAEKKAKDIVDRARKGERFPDLAQANSDAPTAQDGGALDPAKKEDLNQEILNLVWDQPRGYVTDPVKRANGLLILRVDEHPKAGLAPFEEVKLDIQNILYQPLFGPAMRSYLTKLRENAYLEIKPGFTDTGAAPGKDTTWIDPAQLKPETKSKEELLSEKHKRHILGIPLPGTTASKTGTSSSK
jgi:parvulin-like peptidyl-prolyl isomerase